MPCREPHPERAGIFCESPDESPHYGEHYCYDAGDWLNWANPNEPPPPIKGLRKNLSDAQAKKAVRRTDPGTSRDAAEKAQIVAGTHRAMVLDILSSAGRPMSAREIGNVAIEQGRVRSISSCESVRRRALELLDEGHLATAGECDSGTLLVVAS